MLPEHVEIMRSNDSNPIRVDGRISSDHSSNVGSFMAEGKSWACV